MRCFVFYKLNETCTSLFFQQAMSIYQSSNSVKHMLHRIRHDDDGANRLDRYQNNREFVAFINAFADRTQPMPSGWQQMLVNNEQPIIFVDHKRRKTTLIDPRLPYRPVFASTTSTSYGRTSGARRRTRSAPNGRSSSTVGFVSIIINWRVKHVSAATTRS